MINQPMRFMANELTHQRSPANIMLRLGRAERTSGGTRGG